jgi:hypothetical protein|nr:MAG TPA: hypothetical protein [Caudoviricetes sp.]
MNYIKLNGVEFDADVAISAYNRNFNVLDGPNAGRVLTGRMIRDVIGTYLGHKITVFRRGDDYAGLDEFWEYLYQHSIDDSVLLEAADGQKTISYQAYYTSASQDIEKVEKGVNFWGEIEVNFIPIDAQLKR